MSSKVNSAFNETVLGQGEFSSSHMLRFSEGAIIQSLNYLNQSFIKLIPPYIIQKIDTDSLQYLKASYQSFLPNVDPLEIPVLL